MVHLGIGQGTQRIGDLILKKDDTVDWGSGQSGSASHGGETRHTVDIIHLLTHSTQACNTIISCDSAAQTQSVTTVFMQS
jgi:hypothetical protein